ncbi:MAG: POT family MFS transporter [Planctomycetaceae bacterium]
MAERKYRTAPVATTGMPGGVPYIIGNELAERFSFYGMKGILTVFMTKHLVDASGQPDYLSDENAKAVYHLFTAGAYFFPLIGAIIADVLWGKYKTILWISLMYCLGHGCLALMDLGPVTGRWDMAPFMYAGLILIAVGAGGIKPCVSAHVGDQFGSGNKHMLTQIFNWFYFAINFGAAASTILTPILLATVGPWLAFGLPGVLMGIATFLFWLGRHKFVHVPPSGWAKFRNETLSPEGRRALLNLAPLFLVFVPVFWAIFDQTGSAWVLQAESMNRQFFGVTWMESQVQAVNPVLILTLIPVFAFVVYPAMNNVFRVTPLRKVGIGFVLTATAFGISALIETSIANRESEPAAKLWAALPSNAQPKTLELSVQIAKASGWSPAQIQVYETAASSTAAADLWRALKTSSEHPPKLRDTVKAARFIGWSHDQINPFLESMPSIGWQFLAYLVLTSAEIMVSIVCLEFAYTQSPPRMKSFIMGVYFLGVSLGNVVVALVNVALEATKDEQGNTVLQGANYYWAFAAMMLITTGFYLVFAKRYKGGTFIQSENGPWRVIAEGTIAGD